MGIDAEFAIGLDLADCLAGEDVACRILHSHGRRCSCAHENVAATRHRRRIGLIAGLAAVATS